MLFEIGAAMLTTSAVSALFNLPLSRRRKLSIIFQRNGFVRQVGKSTYLPKAKPAIKTDLYTEYEYVLPLGATVTDKLIDAITQAFAGEVAVTQRDGRIQIRFYNATLPEKLPYDSAEPTEGWRVPIGMSLDGAVTHDFDKVPHMTVAGATRQGKTVFMKALITHLTEEHGRDAQLYLIDMKGGLEFGKLEQLTNVVGVASDIIEAYNLLAALQHEFYGELADFRRKGYANILDTEIARRRFIFVDEAAQIAPTKGDDKETKIIKNECLAILSEVTRVAGALGYRLIYATQYPTADTLPRQIKQNSDAKITFRLPTSIASNVAIDESGAEKLTMPGRLIYRTHERVEAQGYYLSDDEMRRRLKLRKCGPKGGGNNGDKHYQPKMDSAPGGDIITFI
ncbi:FtsK/SpoIIIE domain-containing protein [Terribacillus saccharophilus]|uniref:FtsK/SpoIIIE domain-containing protein n=1 Tax=Terribacillus saccharophilus TaxID=361277 RepID=UPI003D2D42A7